MKDTTGFLRNLDAVKSVPDNVYLVYHDIKSLHTSMPNGEGRKVVKKSFDKDPSKNVAAKVITTFLDLISTLINVLFNCTTTLS